MLQIVKALQDLPFSALMEVYIEGNQKKGDLLQAEQDFYQYLKEGFFTRAEDCCCLWMEAGKPVSALRLQAYQDGLLLNALETAPEHRRKGYARALVQAVTEQFPERKIYVHIHQTNAASRKLHEGCGFRKISDTAVLADGSFTSRSGTYVYNEEWQRG